MRCCPPVSHQRLQTRNEFRMGMTIVQTCRHVSSSVWSMRVRHRHLYAVPHHREELMSCLQFGPCEQFKKNRKTHVRFQHCIHFLVLHELRTMGEDHKSIWIPLRCGVLQEWGVWTLCRCEARSSTAYPCYQFESNSFIEPWFDEQYVDYGMNKLIWIFRLRVADYKFRVLLHSFAVHVPHPRWITTVSMMNRTTLSSDMDVIRKKNGGFTEMENYMREFIVGLKKEGKELKTLLPLCNGERSNRLWKRLTEWIVLRFAREILYLVFPNKTVWIWDWKEE